jgi:hypothetical protein
MLSDWTAVLGLVLLCEMVGVLIAGEWLGWR